jgi:2-C-methyl-D-erythritol 4-phosphate cytidylyltransferase
MSQYSIIITAGGIGKRMGGTLPKQFILVEGKPILMHTLEVFHAFDSSAQIIITLPNEWVAYWKELVHERNCTIPHELVDGGTERYHSIKNALSICKGEFIAVHDGVRPLVNHQTIQNCFDAVREKGQVIPVVSVKESLRMLFDDTSKAVPRANYCLVQTPQVFRAEVLKMAYEREFHAAITDDASLVEEAGYPITLVEGNEENIKITTQFDLKIAELSILKNGNF